MANNDLYQDLAQYIAGDLLTDLVSRRLYATDASIYEEIPRAVVRPKNKDDCIKIVKFAHQHHIPLIPRAAGTSTAGQCVGNGMIVDVSRYMTRIIGEVENNTILVQPGVILDELNQFVANHQLKFSQDISTSNRCMIGGMIGNNACGLHSLIYGTTRDHLLELEVVLFDGTMARFAPLNQSELENKLTQNDLEGQIYQTVYNTVEFNQSLIKNQYPRPDIIRRNTGYALDYLLNHQPWNKLGKPFNLAPFICGSEGTLTLITEATLQLIPTPKHKILICVHFYDLMRSMYAVNMILQHHPAAIELIDKKILDCSKNNLIQQGNRFWIEGDPQAVLVIEFFGENIASLTKTATQLIQDLKQKKLGYAHPIIEGQDIEKVWAVRKAGFNLLMGKVAKKKAVAVIEDTAVAIPDLVIYIDQVRQIMEYYQTECVYYGHVSVGLLHLRPEFDLSDPIDKQKFIKIANEIAELVAKFKGSLSGEHGDGRVRSPYIKQILGQEIYSLLTKIKQVFDPNNIFNPNKIINYLPIEQNLRAGGKETLEFTTQFDWSKDLNLIAATEKCNGGAVCRKSLTAEGAMCPSYQVTQEEYYSTRGRANLLRQALYADNYISEFASEELKKTLDLCLSCKACKSECPANVDIARLKAEFLNHYYQQKGMPFKIWIMRYYATILYMGSFLPNISNFISNQPIIKTWLKISPQRQLPLIKKQSLQGWWQKNSVNPQNKTVIILCDIFTQYHEPQIGQAIIQFLQHNSYAVKPIFLKNSPRLLISQGLLKPAKKAIEQLLKSIDLFSSDAPIIGIEPSELLTLRDEATDLLEPAQKQLLSLLNQRAKLFEEFILQELEAGNIDKSQFRYQEKSLWVHTHCHQKASIAANLSLEALKYLPGAKVKAIKAGCCGMAGSFGYEHYDLSMQIGEMQLFPAIRQVPSDAIIVANGTSCRQQIKDGVDKIAWHLGEVFWDYMR
ncbi:MAG: FAD-binding protein [Thiomargarita sp.]|nr:FAD-binding protein [Thiomargarita sp.]